MQGDFNCEASSQADFILNYFLSKFLKFLLKFSISSQPSWQAGTIKATLEGGNARKNLLHKVGRLEIAAYWRGEKFISSLGDDNGRMWNKLAVIEQVEPFYLAI